MPEDITWFFHSEDSFGEIYLLFLLCVLPLFDKAIRVTEGKSTTAVEVYSVLDELRNTLRDRKQKCFVGLLCRCLLQKCASAIRVNAFKKEVYQYYKIALEYIERWLDFSGYTGRLHASWDGWIFKAKKISALNICSLESLGFQEE